MNHLVSARTSSRHKLEPLTQTQRPSSAQPNLQSHPCFHGSLFYDNQRATNNFEQWRKRVVHKERAETQAGGRIQKDYELEQIIWSQSVKQARRLTLTNMQNISDWDIILLKKQKSYAIAALSEARGKLEEKMSLNALNDLHMLFSEADKENRGFLHLEEFKTVVKQALRIQGRNDDEITSLFMKIDSSCDGKISWEEFCTFMQLNFSEKEDTVKRQKEVTFNTPARSENNPHRYNVQKVACTNDNQFMVMGSDGQVSFWNPSGKFKNLRKDIIEKRVVGKAKGDKQDNKRTRIKWITDFVIMTEFSKILVGTGDCELQFWELSSFGFEPYCQLSALETAPLKIAYACTDRDYVTIAYGDTDGCVNIFIFSAMGETLRLWKASPLIAHMPVIHVHKALDSNTIKYIRWKSHNDWVEQIRIEQRLNQIISCSNDENNALIIGCIIPSTDIDAHQQANQLTSLNGSTSSQPNELNASNQQQQLNSSANEIRKPSQQQQQQQQQQQTASSMPQSASSLVVKRRQENNETVFRIYKGVKTFDFSAEKNLLITGGMDRIIRLYNPYVPARPIARLKRHNAPIFFLHLSNEDNRIFTMSTDKCLYVWDMVDHSCLASVRPKTHKITGELQACCYNSNTKSILICTDKVASLSLKLKTDLHAEVVLSHKEAVTCCLYNKEFKQLISCTEAGTVKLWDLETGRDVFEYTNAHDESAITCMSFDETGRRLITGGRDGTCKLWNFNNGHCLKILRNEDKQEISDVKYTRIYNNKFIVCVGWDRKINIFDDDLDDVKLFLEPNARWIDDIESGHKEDILCVAKSEANLLATASYDGEIIVWNMVSGHIFCKLSSPKPDDYKDENLDGDLSVNKLIFLSRQHLINKNSAHLIASGPYGMIHFWSVFNGNELYGRFKINNKHGTNVQQMIIDSKYENLFIADNHGYIYHWDVEDYASQHKETQPPELVRKWRAHVEIINTIEYIELAKVLITCSNDCTIRVWTFDGNFIGTFGQEETWNLYDPKTYKHPLVPYDILIDENSLPEVSVAEENDDNTDTEDKKFDFKERLEKSFQTLFRNTSIDDEAIAQQLKTMNVSVDKIGKRLRHEKYKPMIVSDKGPRNHFQMLKYYDYDDAPKIELPPVVKNKTRTDDIYNF